MLSKIEIGRLTITTEKQRILGDGGQERSENLLAWSWTEA